MTYGTFSLYFLHYIFYDLLNSLLICASGNEFIISKRKTGFLLENSKKTEGKK